jgi:probable F420-dependent oxidoreductase
MAAMRPFRFLGLAASGLVSGDELITTARKAESMGYSGLVLPDHLIEQHAPIPVLTMVAAATERLRVGTFVSNVDLRHPAVLAQDFASLDVLSGGRLQIGIGAGWNRPEYDAIGLRFDRPAIRTARLAEAITVLKGCFADGPFSYAGEHFTITEYDGLPKPVQRPHPPLFVGGGGRRTLTLAGQQANIVGLAPRLMPGDQTRPTTDPRSITIAATAEKIGWIRAAAGDRFADLELNCYPSGGPIMITDNARPEAQRRADLLRQQTGYEIDADDVLASPHVYIGSLQGLTEKFLQLREELGITSFMIDQLDELAPIVETLAAG